MKDRTDGLPDPTYGRFSADGREYIVTDFRTPRPWINVIANERVGLTVSQTGSGFSWVDNSQLAVTVRWQQDLAEDRSGRFLFLRDRELGALWSLAPAPCWPVYDSFACRHGLGYTTFESRFSDIEARWTLFVEPSASVELWSVVLRNHSGRRRVLDLSPFLEWNCGTTPSPRREFQKLFIETSRREEVILAGSHMWDVASERWGHWNTSYPYWAAFGSAQPVLECCGDKTSWLGRNGDWARPNLLAGNDPWPRSFGRHYDPIASLLCPITLEAGETFEGGFVLAVASTPDEACELVRTYRSASAMERSRRSAVSSWHDRLARHRMVTPEPTLDVLNNDWLRYQAIGSRLWARAGYYQQSGAFGFRDQLQDSQVWLTIDPERCRSQVRLHAGHQFGDGSVHHWWHPLTEAGHTTRMTDDLLWLGFVACNYMRETGDLSILEDRAPFLEEPGDASIGTHIERAFERVFSRFSARGLPLIGAGDWNDGLSAVGLLERGESIWLAHFLAGLLADWSVVLRLLGDQNGSRGAEDRRSDLIAAVNQHAWDGAWYRRATLDSGAWIGSRLNSQGAIYLNSQTWAILNDVAPPERAETCWGSVCEHLLDDAGALLLAPAYETPDEAIGYITRYAPGLRENGGVYSHAAVWAIAAAAKRRDPAALARLLRAINPSLKDSDSYWAEPYVLPGNVDGPASPLHGRAGWTWYTGSAAWLPRVVSEWVFGVRPTWSGLLLDPCLPTGWTRCGMHRPYRGADLDIEIEGWAGCVSWLVEVDGVVLPGGILRQVTAGGNHRIRIVGKPR
jgi:cellobiose phosphorylase